MAARRAAQASIQGEVPVGARLSDMVNAGGGGRCAITLELRKLNPPCAGHPAYTAVRLERRPE